MPYSKISRSSDIRFLDIGKKHLDRNEYTDAIKSFDAVLKKDPRCIDAYFYKGVALWSMQSLENGTFAIECFEEVLRLNPNHSEARKYLGSIWLFIATENRKLRHIDTSSYAFEQVLIYLPDNALAKEALSSRENHITNEDLIRPFVFNDEYQHKMKVLSIKHKTLKQMAPLQQIEWIIELIKFINTYYQFSKKPFNFTKAQFFESNEQGQRLRAETLRDTIAQQLPHMFGSLKQGHPSDKIARVLYQVSNTAFEDGSVDLFFSESTLILRMIFETIHQIPRAERIKHARKLPWGDNSWFYLEFLGTLFSKPFEDQLNNEVSLIFPSILEPSQWQQLKEFHSSIQQFQCLVRIVTLAILKEDLQMMLEFFISVAAHLNDPQHVEVIKMAELPNLPIVVDYFKQSFNLYKLCSLLPHAVDEAPLILLGKNVTKSMEHLTPYTRFEHTNFSPVNNGLKGRYGFLRQVSCIGELLTNRNFGPDLESITFINPLSLQTIRNGLSHIEELVSGKMITDLEHSETDLNQLYSELHELRNSLCLYIIQRQQQFPAWPQNTVTAPFMEWHKAMEGYWTKIKEVYHSHRSSYDEQMYAPKVPLIPERDINYVLAMFKTDTDEDKAFKESIRKQVNGEIRITFKKTITQEIKSQLIPEQLDKENRKYLERQLSLAFDKFTNLKSQCIDQIKEKNKQEEDRIRAGQEEAMKAFPFIANLAKKFREQLEDKLHKMSAQHLLVNLNIHFKKLIDLLQESGISFDPNAPLSEQIKTFELFKKLMNTDIQLFLGCCFATTLIFSILNQFSTSTLAPNVENTPELNKWFELANALKLRLTDWVPLKNILMHSDGILDSDELFYYQVHFHKLPTTLSYSIIELLFNIQPKIRNMPIAMMDKVRVDKSNQIKQEEPLQFEHFKTMFDTILSRGHQNNPAMFYANPIIKPAAAIALDAPAIQQRPQAAP